MPYDLPLPSTLYGETVTSGTRTVGSAGSDVFVLGGQRGVVGGGAGEDVYAVTTVSYASIFDDGLPHLITDFDAEDTLYVGRYAGGDGSLDIRVSETPGGSVAEITADILGRQDVVIAQVAGGPTVARQVEDALVQSGSEDLDTPLELAVLYADYGLFDPGTPTSVRAAAGYTRETSASELFVFDGDRGDVALGRGEIDVFVFTDTADAGHHRIRDYSGYEDVLDLSLLVEGPAGTADIDQFVRLEEVAWGGGVSTLVQFDRDGGGDAFETVVALSDTRDLDLDLLLTSETLLL